MSTLVTGSLSGLGHFLSGILHAEGLHKRNIEILQNKEFDTVIHCAFPAPHSSKEEFEKIYELTEKLIQINSSKFIFISSNEVYSKKNILNCESDQTPIDELDSLYARYKIMCEELVYRQRKDFLILRPVSLIGKNKISRNIQNLLFEDSPQLSVTENSKYNFVTHEEIAILVRRYLEKSISGIINVARNRSVSLKEISDYLGKKPKYGTFNHTVAHVDNSVSKKLVPDLDEDSFEFIKRKFHGIKVK